MAKSITESDITASLEAHTGRKSPYTPPLWAAWVVTVLGLTASGALVIYLGAWLAGLVS
jgi:hypothetical protein